MGFEQVNTICLFPGPELGETPPFPMIRVAENEVSDYVAKGWTTVDPAAPVEEKPKGKAKK